ncbi:MAG: extracellular solute-binding protein [Vallitalea sp.]|jgi:raffinose/stachyose/melibiose transport system substrate-binding protein|nr:extracellular solute-binding protein [Vallitalea sp.]
MKKIQGVAILLSMLLLVFSITGCGSKTNTDQKVSDNSEVAQKKDENKKIKLKVMILSEDSNRQAIYKDYYSKNIKEAFPNYEVEFELPGSADAYSSKLRIYNASGELPDVFWGQDIVYQSGNALDLTDIIKEDGYLDKFSNPAALIPAKDGKIYCLNSGTDSFFAGPLYFNKDIFEKEGLKTPTSFNELVSVSKKLAEKGYTPISVTAWAIQNFLFADLVTMDDHTNIIKLQNGEIDFNNEVIVEAANKLKTLVDIGAFPKNVTSIEHQVHVDMFNKGEAAMLYHPIWVLPAVSKDINLGYTYLPEFSGAKAINCWGSSTTGGFMVSKKSKNTEAAVKVAEWLTTQDAEFFNKVAGNAVALKGYSISEDSHSIVKDTYNKMIDEETVKIPNLPTNYMAEAVIAEYGTNIEKLIFNQLTPEQFCNIMNDLYKNQ